MTEPTDERSASEIRAVLDAAIADALPISGGQVRKRLKQLRRALAKADEERKRCARPGCGHRLSWHRQNESPFWCAGDLMHCQCKGWVP